MDNPGKAHWQAVKWILWYLNGSTDRGLVYGRGTNGRHVTGFCDSDYASYLDCRRFLTYYIFTLKGSAISWHATLHSPIVLWTTEAEYMVATKAVKEALWFKEKRKENNP